MTMNASAPSREAMLRPIAQLAVFPWNSFGTRDDDASILALRWTSSNAAVSCSTVAIDVLLLIGCFGWGVVSANPAPFFLGLDTVEAAIFQEV